MQLYKYFAIFFLPLLVAAVPAPDPVANPAPVPTSKQSGSGLPGIDDIDDIGGGLGNLLNSIGPIMDLLKPDTVKDIGVIIHNAAIVLNDEHTKVLTHLLGEANKLLTDEFIKQVKGLISDVAPV